MTHCSEREKFPSALLDDPAGAGKTHVFAAAMISGELALIEAIRRIGENDSQVGQICPSHSSADDVAVVVRTTHPVIDLACVRTGNARAALIQTKPKFLI